MARRAAPECSQLGVLRDLACRKVELKYLAEKATIIEALSTFKAVSNKKKQKLAEKGKIKSEDGTALKAKVKIQPLKAALEKSQRRMSQMNLIQSRESPLTPPQHVFFTNNAQLRNNLRSKSIQLRTRNL